MFARTSRRGLLKGAAAVAAVGTLGGVNGTLLSPQRVGATDVEFGLNPGLSGPLYIRSEYPVSMGANITPGQVSISQPNGTGNYWGNDVWFPGGGTPRTHFTLVTQAEDFQMGRGQGEPATGVNGQARAPVVNDWGNMSRVSGSDATPYFLGLGGVNDPNKEVILRVDSVNRDVPWATDYNDNFLFMSFREWVNDGWYHVNDRTPASQTCNGVDCGTDGYHLTRGGGPTFAPGSGTLRSGYSRINPFRFVSRFNARAYVYPNYSANNEYEADPSPNVARYGIQIGFTWRSTTSASAPLFYGTLGVLLGHTPARFYAIGDRHPNYPSSGVLWDDSQDYAVIDFEGRKISSVHGNLTLPADNTYRSFDVNWGTLLRYFLAQTNLRTSRPFYSRPFDYNLGDPRAGMGGSKTDTSGNGTAELVHVEMFIESRFRNKTRNDSDKYPLQAEMWFKNLRHYMYD